MSDPPENTDPDTPRSGSMDVLYMLVPLSVVLVFVIVAVLAWSVWSGQFEGIEQEGQRILEDDDSPDAGPPR